MNISQLRTFVAVVENGSFSDAARAMGISQPAVTMQVQALEADVGATLLDRRYRRVDLTEAGQALLPHAVRVLEQVDAARDDIAELAGMVTGRLTIAASTTPGDYVVPRLLGAYIANYPEVGVSLFVSDTSAVVDSVETGTAQLGICGATVRGAKVDFTEVGVDELVLIAHPSHRLASAGSTTLSELAEDPWVMRESGSGTRQVAEKILAEQGLDPAELHVVVELGTGEAIISAVEGGLGVSVVSRYVADKALRLGMVVELAAKGLPATRPLYAVTAKGTRTRAAQAFLDQLTARAQAQAR